MPPTLSPSAAPAASFEARLARALTTSGSGGHWWSSDIFAVYAAEGFARSLDIPSWGPLHAQLTTLGIVRVHPSARAAPMTVDAPHLFRYCGPKSLSGRRFAFTDSHVTLLPSVYQTPRGVQWALPGSGAVTPELHTAVGSAIARLVEELDSNAGKLAWLNKARRAAALSALTELSHSSPLTDVVEEPAVNVDEPIVWSSLAPASSPAPPPAAAAASQATASSPSTLSAHASSPPRAYGASYLTHIQTDVIVDGGSDLGPDSDIVVLRSINDELANTLYDMNPPVNTLGQLAALNCSKPKFQALSAVARAVLAGIAADTPATPRSGLSTAPASTASSTTSSPGASTLFTSARPDVSPPPATAPTPDSFIGQLEGLSSASIWALCRVLPAATIRALASAPDYILRSARDTHEDVQDLTAFRSIAQSILALAPASKRPESTPSIFNPPTRSHPVTGLLIDSVSLDEVTASSSISVLSGIDNPGVVFLACQEPPILTLGHLAQLPQWRRRSLADTRPDIDILADSAAALLASEQVSRR